MFSSPVPCLRRVYRDDDGDGRFPGDAATMEKIKIEKVLYAWMYLGYRFTLHDIHRVNQVKVFHQILRPNWID